MTTIAIIYYSGYGHTAKLADAVTEGVRASGASPVVIRIPEDGVITDADWTVIEAADALIYGSPTYMGNVAWQFKRFADASSKLWAQQALAGRVAGGFTVSASTVGDKGETMSWLITFAQQHGQLWVGPGQMPSNTLANTPADVNWTGFSTGLMGIARSDSTPDEGPYPGDLEAGRQYGQRIARIAARHAGAAREAA
ncbi:flavodoxin family protein [Paracoccus sp. SCSIO 75233]|uniref:flavodoxin family protein n=1 Tax=Paracoccus sp. SCSIO 75233 TaxID=3017782 RepID=UPI0022F11829|nr:flavodoxin family protein [Paracoccus sp. SCSIO 75233]WBU54378.1 flavodoxin family protein [Paracoccus sp. SCSIO 75233]